MKIKQLSFYIVAIIFVLILFSLTTSYGETNLKTANKIEGNYKMQSIIPNCGDNLQLIIEQSGIYINAAIAPLGKNSNDKPKNTVFDLSGKWQGQKLSLLGNSNTCKSLIEIMAGVENQQIIGKITISNGTISNSTSDFSAAKLAVPE